MTHRGRGVWLIRHVGWHIMKEMAITTHIGLDKKGNMVLIRKDIAHWREVCGMLRLCWYFREFKAVTQLPFLGGVIFSCGGIYATQAL